MENYITMPSGRPEGTAPTEDKNGAYYYKYSYSWTSKSASTNVNLVDTQLKFDSSKPNNGYVFLSCIGTNYNPPEYGIMTTPELEGVWYLYTRKTVTDSSSNGMTRTSIAVIEPDTMAPSNGIYTYTKSKPITITITLSGTNIIGKIYKNGTLIAGTTQTVSGAPSGISATGSLNTFMLGTSFVPDPGTVSPGNRSSYMKYVYLQDGKLYSSTNYGGTATEWVPDQANSVTYYGLLCRPDYITYNRFGTTDEEISIDYT